MQPNDTYEIDISATIDGVKIPARFVMPKHPVAAVLLIPGPLNSDVDGNYAPLPI